MVTLRNAIGYISIFLFAAALVSRLSIHEMLTTALFALVAHVVLALVSAGLGITPLVWMVSGDGGTIIRLKGFTGHALRFSDMAALSVLCIWSMWLQGWSSTKALLVTSVCGIAALILAHERMPIAALFVAVLSVGRYRTVSISCVMLIALAAAAIGVLSPDAIVYLATVISRSGNPDEVFTLTGRLDIWHRAVEAFMHQPLLGYGFASAGPVLGMYQLVVPSTAPSGAEGVFTQNLLGLGLIGTALLAVPYAFQIGFAIRHRDSLLNPFISYAFLTGLTTSSTIGGAPNVLTLFWMIVVCLTGKAARARIDESAISGKTRWAI